MRSLITSLALALAAFLLYLPSADFGFIYYDDVRILADHPELYNGASLRDSVTAIVTAFPREEPLLFRDLTWALDSRIFGFRNPRGFHFVNVVLHACVVALCFASLLRITRRYFVALFAAVCFLALAVHVEPVAWIMGRKDLLAALFGFLALLAHSCALDAKAGAPRVAWYGASLVAMTLALFSKISALAYPAMLFLLALFQPALRGDEPAGGRFPWARIPGALAGILPHLVVVLLVFRWYHGVLSEFGLLDRGYTATPAQHVVNLLIFNPLAWLKYAQILLAPGDVVLFHAWPANAAIMEPRYMAVAAAAWLVLAVLAVVLLARRRDLAFYFLTFFALMVPHMNIQYIGIWVANRYLYFAAFCVTAAAVTLAADVWCRGRRPAAWAAAAAMVLFVAVNGWCQARSLPFWRSAETMWPREMARADAVPDVYYNLAAFYYTTAIRTPDPAERENWLRKTEEVVARAQERFPLPAGTPPVSQQNLLLLHALTAIVRAEPAERRLAALQAVESVAPRNDAVLWQLTQFYYKEALQMPDGARRAEAARQALAYYARYHSAVHHDAGFAAMDRGVRAEFRSDFPFLAEDLEKLE